MEEGFLQDKYISLRGTKGILPFSASADFPQTVLLKSFLSGYVLKCDLFLNRENDFELFLHVGFSLFGTSLVSASKRVHSTFACASQLIAMLGGHEIAYRCLRRISDLRLFSKPIYEDTPLTYYRARDGSNSNITDHSDLNSRPGQTALTWSLEGKQIFPIVPILHEL